MPGKVLVAGAVATSRIAVAAQFGQAHYDVITAASGADALSLQTRREPNAIVMDAGMALSKQTPAGMATDRPVSLCRALLLQNSQCPVIVLEGADRMEQAERMTVLQEGAATIFRHPYSYDVLIARVRRAIRDHRQQIDIKLQDIEHKALGLGEPAAPFHCLGAVGWLDLSGSNGAKQISALKAHLPDSLCSLTIEEAIEGNVLSLPLDVLTIDATSSTPQEALRLIPAVKASCPNAHTLVSLILPTGSAPFWAAQALDLGVTEVFTTVPAAEELALRLRRLVCLKQKHDRHRRGLQKGIKLALTDPLTGLSNRRFAKSHLARLKTNAGPQRARYAVMMIDLDRFKSVNDTYGHTAGDMVLKQMSGILRQNLRNADLIARVGGEEFMVIMPVADIASATQVAERLRATAAETAFDLPPEFGAKLHQTISIGIAISDFFGTEEPPQRVQDRADRALFRAKDRGRNLVHFGCTPHEAATDQQIA